MTRTAIVTLDDGREVEVDVEVPGSLAEESSQFLQKPLNVLTMPGLPFVPAQTGIDVAKSGIAAEKKYPAQNLLPAVGGVVGGFVGSEAGMPALGTVFGTQAGGAAKQYVDVLRGKKVPETPAEALEETYLPALGAGALDLGTSAIFGIGKTIGAGKLAKEGMTKFSEKMVDMFKPASKEVVEKLGEQLKNVPAVSSQESVTAKTIGDIFERRGISTGSGTLTPVQAKNLAESGLSADDIQSLTEEIGSLKGSVSKISRGKTGITLSSELKTTPLRKYQELGNVLSDLENPGLTYEKLGQVRTRVGDLANFDKPDIMRTPIEKLYGMSYYTLGEDMAMSAEKKGLGSVHSDYISQLRKSHQEKLLKNILETSTTRTKGISRIKYSDLANNLRSYTGDELTRKFGEDAKYVQTLRDLAETHAETFGQGKMLSGGISTHGSAYGFLHPHVISRARTPVYIDRILTKYLGEEGVKEYGDLLFSRFSNPQKVTSGFAKGGTLPFAPMLQDEENP